MQGFEEILDQLEVLETTIEKNDFLAACLNEAREEGNWELLTQLSEFLVKSDEEASEKYAPVLRFSALLWLVESIQFAIEETRDEESEQRMALSYALYEYMWYFKWILPALPGDSVLPKEAVTDAEQIMLSNYEEMDFSLAMYHKTLMLVAMAMGEKSRAQQEYEDWQAAERDIMSDCEACEVAEQINFHYFMGEYSEVLVLAEPILAGELTCSEVPHIVYGAVLGSYLALEQTTKARKLLPKAIQTIEEVPSLTSQIIKMIEIALRLGEIELAQDLMERHQGRILDQSSDLVVLQYFIASSPLNEVYQERAVMGAAAFDERNGNDYYQTYLTIYLQEVEKNF